MGGGGAARDDAAGRAGRLARAPGAARGGHVGRTRTEAATAFITVLRISALTKCAHAAFV